jgi:squalene-hopene/tetraprenyl-beta-curcumene cyclase
LLERQNPAGWWTDELETNVTMTAEHVLLLRFLGLSVEPIREGAIRHFLVNQREDGSWGLYNEAAADLSTTIEAYVALKVLGVDPGSDPMRRALRVIHQQGGVARARVFTKIWLALFGEYPWAGVPSMPPELVHLPPSIPFNLYDFACWARGTIAPLLIVLSRKPIRPLGVGVPELVVPGTDHLRSRVPGSGPFWWADKLQKLYESLPLRPGRGRSRSELVDWIVERQEADGGWGGIQPPWVYSLIALNLEGMSVDHPVMCKGLYGLDGFAWQDTEGWRLQACMSPVWDTAWAVLALRAAGVEPEHEPIQRAVQWLISEQIDRGGDWQVRVPDVECGGWAFEFANDMYPDIDDTALVVIALLLGTSNGETCAAIERAVRWLRAMRSSNGAWGAFDKDNTRQIVYSLPFADFGALLDPPSEDVTAHVLEMLGRLGCGPDDPMVAGGISYLRRMQRPDGSWFGRWGVNHIYGTWCVMTGLAQIPGAEASTRDMMERGGAWLLAHQNPDGGWGETCHSYQDASFAGVGESTASQTAWALLALEAATLGRLPACDRGIAFLRATQEDGTWREPLYTGTGFPRDFYLNYHMYRHLFPLLALGTLGRGGA